MDKLTKSEIKTSVKGFNSMPSRRIIKEELERLLSDKFRVNKFRIVDTDRAYWKNADDTLVIAIKKTESVTFGIKIGYFAQQTSADELHYEASGKEIVVRFWWD